MYLKSIAAFALLCATAIGAPPQLKVSHTNVTIPGDILRVTAVAPDAKSYTWRVWTDIKDTKPTEDQIEAIKSQAESVGLVVSRSETNTEETVYQLECDGGKSIDLPSWAGQNWIIFCCVANATGEQASTTTVVKVPGDKPVPPVPPGPNPPPVPPTPLNDLSSFVADDLKAVVAAHHSVPEIVKFGMVAGAYKQVAEEIEQGKLTTRDQLLDKTKSLVMSAMGNSYDLLWKSTTRKIELKLSSVISTPLDPKAHVQPWRDIAKGIESAIGVN